MNLKMSFTERAKLAMELLSKQSPVTLKEAKAQAIRVKNRSQSKKKKQRDSVSG
ncbi:hypothetical protein [Capnocytophaga granulosa]|uniref:hypothetical protein n=1 Tax=Capnocytophaga granulosa TaxID=45242 RepID=UPI0028EAB1B4|nr:hypothetical protein [Capnocytophaga granulosa]